MKCFRNEAMLLNKWKRNNCTGKEVELWLSLKFTCDFQLLLLKNKSVLWICILARALWSVPFSKSGDCVTLFQCYILPGFLAVQGLMV